jgi:hypothetical protein
VNSQLCGGLVASRGLNVLLQTASARIDEGRSGVVRDLGQDAYALGEAGKRKVRRCIRERGGRRRGRRGRRRRKRRLFSLGVALGFSLLRL